MCDRHRIRWCVGANLISSWRHETEEDRERNRRRLSDYEEVEPYLYERLAEDEE